jgi:hypothetical protein
MKQRLNITLTRLYGGPVPHVCVGVNTSWNVCHSQGFSANKKGDCGVWISYEKQQERRVNYSI